MTLYSEHMLFVNPQCSIPEDAIQESFVRASGPGGQHVNKVSTAVQLRFDPGQTCLSEEVCARLMVIAGHLATQSGIILITVQDSRSRERNREEARRRLAQLIRSAFVVPKPRRVTKPSAAKKEKRLMEKKKKSSLKQSRQRVNPDE